MTASRSIPPAPPAEHPSRVRGPDEWNWGWVSTRPPRFGRDAAHAEWVDGFRLAAKMDLASRIVRAWSIVPAAVSERDVAGGPAGSRACPA